jgi:hypothetical protein
MSVLGKSPLLSLNLSSVNNTVPSNVILSSPIGIFVTSYFFTCITTSRTICLNALGDIIKVIEIQD